MCENKFDARAWYPFLYYLGNFGGAGDCLRVQSYDVHDVIRFYKNEHTIYVKQTDREVTSNNLTLKNSPFVQYPTEKNACKSP